MSANLVRRYKTGQWWPPLVGTITDADGRPVDLSGATAELAIRLVDAATPPTTLGTAEIIAPPTDGRVRYRWTEADLATAGHYYAWFVLRFPPDSALGYVPHDQEDGGIEQAIDIVVEAL
jgi:hypothetical protein